MRPVEGWQQRRSPGGRAAQGGHRPLRRHVRRRSPGGEARAGAASEICSEPRGSGTGLAGALQHAAHEAEREDLRTWDHMPPRTPSNREHLCPSASDGGEARGHRGCGGGGGGGN
ncbi:unnamed protein product [Urochloa humidicola]